MLVLGYTGKFYATWELTNHITSTESDRYTEYTEYKYIRKCGNDLETAHAKFPDLVVENAVRGKKRSFNGYSRTIFTSNETFRFGKYNGKNICSVNDGQYIYWYMNLDNGYITDEHRAYCKHCLIEFFDYTEENGMLISPETREAELEQKRAEEKIIKKACEKKHVYLELKQWPNADGEVVIDGVTYTFPEVRANYYKGYTYYMPVLNGVCKHIRNKVIKAQLEYVFDTIYIDNFTIVMK